MPESIAAGADLVCFSGDKLIGGPQAGIIVGRGELIRKIKKHPLTRMLRVGKMTDLVLEQTLRLFLEPETLLEANPTLRMMTMNAERSAARRQDAGGARTRMRGPADVRLAGGGKCHRRRFDSRHAVEDIPAGDPHARDFCRAIHLQLRRNEPPIIARIERDEVLLDLRTVFEEEEPQILEALIRMVRTR